MSGDASGADGVVESQLLKIGEVLEESLDAELQRLEQPDELERIRQKRLEEMKRRATQQSEWRRKGHGECQELPAEKDFFAAAKESENLVCHFYRDCRPCKILDEHLARLAAGHLETRFIKLQAEKSPFLTQKLGVRVLPTLALLRNSKVVDYVVGFDELGGVDSFPTEVLEARLAKAKVLDIKGDLPSAQRERSNAVRKGGAFELDG